MPKAHEFKIQCRFNKLVSVSVDENLEDVGLFIEYVDGRDIAVTHCAFMTLAQAEKFDKEWAAAFTRLKAGQQKKVRKRR